MKKVGILTYHCIPNFGAQLQTLSTIGYFQEHGYEPIVLNWYPEDLEEFYKRRVPEDQNKIQFDFSQEKMPVSKLCRSMTELCDELSRINLDFIFLGSDALFDYSPKATLFNYSIKKLKKIPIKTTSNHLLPNPFWGSFNDYLISPIDLVGYAISSQNMPYSKLSREERSELGRLLDRFKFLSVRDEWTKKMVESLSAHKSIQVVPDPVFAFNQNFKDIPTKEHILKKIGLPEKYVLISFYYDNLSKDFINRIIGLLEENTDVECVSFPMPEGLRTFDTKYNINLPLTPIEWYALIKYSSGYIGERMHPIVVSLHNEVPFYCFDQYGAIQQIIPRLWSRFIPESSKIYDLLCKCGLEENSCFYSKVSHISPEHVVEKFLSFNKEKSHNFAINKLHEYNRGMQQILSVT